MQLIKKTGISVIVMSFLMSSMGCTTMQKQPTAATYLTAAAVGIGITAVATVVMKGALQPKKDTMPPPRLFPC